MDPKTIGLGAVGVVFAINFILMIGLVALKAIHRTRTTRHEKRRAAYIGLLSRHLAIPNHTDPIGRGATGDSAFLDAVIDLRNTVSGPEIDTLSGIVDRLGLADRQVKALNSRFPLGRRLRAAVSLAEMGDDSTARVLIRHLDDREPEIRIQAARGLGRMQYTAAIDAILERFSVEEPWVRTRFADTLIGFGSKATWPLVAYIRVNLIATDNQGVIEAIRILGTIGDREVGPTLASVLRVTKDPEVKLAAIDALGKVGGPMAIRPLKHSLESEDWRLRAKAMTALGAIGDPSVNWAVAEGLDDANWWVRRNSAAALADLPGGIALLMTALDADDVFARDAAAEALADSGELAAARERLESGEASESDQTLVDYVREQLVVT